MAVDDLPVAAAVDLPVAAVLDLPVAAALGLPVAAVLDLPVAAALGLPVVAVLGLPEMQFMSGEARVVVVVAVVARRPSEKEDGTDRFNVHVHVNFYDASCRQKY